MINDYIHSLHITYVAYLQLSLSFGIAGYACYLFLRKANHRTALCLLVLAGLMFRLQAASDLYLHPWDERYHALVAKNLVNHLLKPTLYEAPVLPYDHENWVANHVWLHKPPLSLWAIAASIAVFGNTEIAVRLPSVIVSSLSIFLIYGIGAMLTDPRTAFLAAFLFSWSSPILELVGGRTPVDHVDTMVLAFVLCGVWCAGAQVRFQKSYLLGLLGLITGLALLTKSLPSLIIPAVWLIWSLCEDKPIFKTVRGLLVVLLIALLVAAPWQLYIRQQYPQEAAWESSYTLRHLFETIEGHKHRWTYYFSKMGPNFTETIYPAIIWFTVSALRTPNASNAVLVAWFLIPYGVFSLAATKMPSYVAIAWPALFLIYAAAWWSLYDLMRYRRSFVRWLAAAGVLLLSVGIVLQVRRTLVQMKKFSRDSNPVWAQQLRKLGEVVPLDKPIVLVNTSHPIEAMFYANLTAYTQVPSPSELRDLQHRGYEIIALDNGSLPAHLAQNPAVKKIAQPLTISRPE